MIDVARSDRALTLRDLAPGLGAVQGPGVGGETRAPRKADIKFWRERGATGLPAPEPPAGREGAGRRELLREQAAFLVTCAFYGAVFLYLLVFRRPPRLGPLGRAVKHWARTRARRLKVGWPDTGACYVAPVGASLVSDAEGVSRLVVYEDGVPLARPHAPHDEIRQHGRGAYSHWKGLVFLSASDNSDPRTNRRRYTYRLT
jgi:hypothetical protein